MSEYDSILFMEISPELKLILDESLEDEMGREETLSGTVISYLNKYIAEDVYNNIKHRLRDNNMLRRIFPNYRHPNSLSEQTFPCTKQQLIAAPRN